jgi:hypothetical protein
MNQNITKQQTNKDRFAEALDTITKDIQKQYAERVNKLAELWLATKGAQTK